MSTSDLYTTDPEDPHWQVPATGAARFSWEAMFPGQKNGNGRDRLLALFRRWLFSRIVPCVKGIGLWGPRLQQAHVDMGVFEMGDSNLDLLMAQDEEVAEKLDAERFETEERERVAEVEQSIEEGAAHVE